MNSTFINTGVFIIKPETSYVRTPNTFHSTRDQYSDHQFLDDSNYYRQTESVYDDEYDAFETKNPKDKTTSKLQYDFIHIVNPRKRSLINQKLLKPINTKTQLNCQWESEELTIAKNKKNLLTSYDIKIDCDHDLLTKPIIDKKVKRISLNSTTIELYAKQEFSYYDLISISKSTKLPIRDIRENCQCIILHNQKISYTIHTSNGEIRQETFHFVPIARSLPSSKVSLAYLEKTFQKPNSNYHRRINLIKDAEYSLECIPPISNPTGKVFWRFSNTNEEKFNELLIDNIKNGTYTHKLVNVNMSNSGKYRCVIFNPYFGEISSDYLHLQIYQWKESDWGEWSKCSTGLPNIDTLSTIKENTICMNKDTFPTINYVRRKHSGFQHRSRYCYLTNTHHDTLTTIEKKEIMKNMNLTKKMCDLDVKEEEQTCNFYTCERETSFGENSRRKFILNSSQQKLNGQLVHQKDYNKLNISTSNHLSSTGSNLLNMNQLLIFVLSFCFLFVVIAIVFYIIIIRQRRNRKKSNSSSNNNVLTTNSTMYSSEASYLPQASKPLLSDLRFHTGQTLNGQKIIFDKLSMLQQSNPNNILNEQINQCAVYDPSMNIYSYADLVAPQSTSLLHALVDGNTIISNIDPHLLPNGTSTTVRNSGKSFHVFNNKNLISNPHHQHNQQQQQQQNLPYYSSNTNTTNLGGGRTNDTNMSTDSTDQNSVYYQECQYSSVKTIEDEDVDELTSFDENSQNYHPNFKKFSYLSSPSTTPNESNCITIGNTSVNTFVSNTNTSLMKSNDNKKHNCLIMTNKINDTNPKRSYQTSTNQITTQLLPSTNNCIGNTLMFTGNIPFGMKNLFASNNIVQTTKSDDNNLNRSTTDNQLLNNSSSLMIMNNNNTNQNNKQNIDDCPNQYSHDLNSKIN
ncbi:hypothetical protein SNEBB_009720 [Seison nebaliae]|nr:hypothetical protein SNEBB_009720 [Seison nebaliae]